MRKSKLFALSLTMLSIFMLTGCGDDDNKDADYRKLDTPKDRLERIFGINDQLKQVMK